MTFYDAVNSSTSRCAVRTVGIRVVYRYWDGRVEIYASPVGRRFSKWWERLRLNWASTEHKDWESVS